MLLRRFGYKITRYIPGRDYLEDAKFFLEGQPNPVFFDVGANKGQTVDKIKAAFPHATIHSFEPSPTTYQTLSKHCSRIPGVSAWNYGVGSKVGTMPLLESTDSEMSSFLEPSELAFEKKGAVKQTTNVEVVTLDSFAATHGIDFIHMLKSDAQGYDFEVLKGAQGLMQENKIALVYFEFNFSDMYKGLPSFHTVFDFLVQNNFSLVTIYQLFYQRKLASWTDLLFINRDFYRKRAESDSSW